MKCEADPFNSASATATRHSSMRRMAAAMPSGVEQVIALNKLNPQVAARLVRTLDHWKKYQPALKKQMQAVLQKVAAAKGLSKDVQEVVVRALG